nr:chain length determinant protein EpsF [uncultured Tolumonas sp.]
MSFQQLWQILLARKKIALGILSLVVITSTVVSLLLPKQYTAEADIAIDTIKVDPITNISMSGQLVAGYMATQVDIISSHNTARKVVEMTGLSQLPEAQMKFQDDTKGKGDIIDWLADSIIKDLDIKPSRESNVISIFYTSTDPAFASAMANMFVEAYKKEIIDMRSNLAQQNQSFFEQQLKSLQKKLEAAQKKLSDYQQQQGIVASDERLDVENQRLNELSTQLVATQGQLIDAQSRLKKEGAVAPDVLNNPLIQQLKSQLALQESKFKQIAAKEGPKHPTYQQAEAELNSARTQLNSQISQYSNSLVSTAENVKQRLVNLQKALDAQKVRVLELKSQRSRLDLLQRDVDNAQQIYQVAMQKLSESSLESSSDLTNVSVLKSAPEPTKHSKPKLLVNLILALFLGGLLGTGFALLLELQDRRIRSAVDLEQLLKLPVLADFSQFADKSVYPDGVETK